MCLKSCRLLLYYAAGTQLHTELTKEKLNIRKIRLLLNCLKENMFKNSPRFDTRYICQNDNDIVQMP